MTKDVQVNDRGRRIGESHPRAKLEDHEIDLIRELYEEMRKSKAEGGLGLTNRQAAKAIAEKFEIGARHAQKIVYCEQRAQTAAKAKRIKPSE